MTPLYLKLALPLVQLLGALLISRRISWRAHPALIAYLGYEATFQPVLVLLGLRLPAWFVVFQLAIRTAVVLEVMKFSRIRLTVAERVAGVTFSVIACAIGSASTQGLRLIEHIYLFRQYYHLLLCAALLAVVASRIAWPMLECRRHKVYRLGVAACQLVLSLAGTFVKGGLGYTLLPYERHTWEAVSLASYVAMIVTSAAMAWAMVEALPRKVPAKVQRAVAARNVVQIRRTA